MKSNIKYYGRTTSGVWSSTPFDTREEARIFATDQGEVAAVYGKGLESSKLDKIDNDVSAQLIALQDGGEGGAAVTRDMGSSQSGTDATA